MKHWENDGEKSKAFHDFIELPLSWEVKCQVIL
jgi:hypothetical protein